MGRRREPARLPACLPACEAAGPTAVNCLDAQGRDQQGDWDRESFRSYFLMLKKYVTSAYAAFIYCSVNGAQ